MKRFSDILSEMTTTVAIDIADKPMKNKVISRKKARRKSRKARQKQKVEK